MDPQMRRERSKSMAPAPAMGGMGGMGGSSALHYGKSNLKPRDRRFLVMGNIH